MTHAVRSQLLPTVGLFCILVSACALTDSRVDERSIKIVHSERWGEYGLAESGLVTETDFVESRLKGIGDVFARRTRALQYAELRFAPTQECLNDSFTQLFMQDFPLAPEVPEGDLSLGEMAERQLSSLRKQCPVARVTRIGEGVVLQARLGAGQFLEHVISGDNPLHIDIGTGRFEMLLVMADYGMDRPGRYQPEDALEAFVYLKGEMMRSQTDACALWSGLAARLATRNLYISIGPNYTFVTRRFPALYPFSKAAMVTHSTGVDLPPVVFVFSSVQGGIYQQLGQGPPSLLIGCEGRTSLGKSH